MFLAADFPDKQATSRALLDLRAKGFTPADLAVFSDSPIEFPRAVLPRPSHMSLAVVTGAVTACLLTIGFVYFTQYNYPLVTGAMPLFSFWATGVVFYELTMFGAIVTSLFWFLRESGLLRRGRRRSVTPVVTPGVISLRIECHSDRAETVRQSLETTGARNIRTLGAHKPHGAAPEERGASADLAPSAQPVCGVVRDPASPGESVVRGSSIKSR